MGGSSVEWNGQASFSKQVLVSNAQSVCESSPIKQVIDSFTDVSDTETGLDWRRKS